MTDLNAMATECFQISTEHGFWKHKEVGDPDQRYMWENPSIWAEKIALIHSEATEMLEALRKGQGKDVLAEECADLLIRLLDFCAARDIDIQAAYEQKVEKNKGRPYLHGRHF